jgi:large subunit ribosomal protein L32
MVVRMRHTRSHTANRRSHHALKNRALSLCSHCGTPNPKHSICANCGWYKGKTVIDVIGKISKKEAKTKEKKKASEESKSEEK